jgi:hypothetical protein
MDNFYNVDEANSIQSDHQANSGCLHILMNYVYLWYQFCLFSRDSFGPQNLLCRRYGPIRYTKCDNI